MRVPVSRLRRLLALFGPFIALVVVALVFRVLAGERFLSAYNLKTVATQTVLVGLGAIGATFVIVSGGIDLSVGSVIALCSVVTAVLLRDGHATVIAVFGGLASGALAGATNGIAVTRLRIVPFIVTLGTMGVARGLAKYLADEQKVDAPARGLEGWMEKTPDPSWLVVAPGVWLLFGFAAIMGFVLERTVFGLHTFAIGSSEPTARLSGIRVERTRVAIYTLGGLFAGLAGVLQFSRLTVGDPTTALGKELDVIAAVVIGGGSLSGGQGGILGSLIGAFLMSLLANGCTLVGLPNYVQEVLVGIIIVAAVGIEEWRKRRGE